VNTDKARQFFGDVVHDIRSRGLLPVVILLAVGVVVVPMVIKGGGEDVPPPPPATIPGTTAAGLQNQPAVLTYNPSVRDYKERLDDLQEKDPFVQQFTNSASSVDEAAAATGSPVDTAPAGDGGGGSTGSGGSGGSSGGSSTGDSGTRFYYYRETDILVGDTSQPLKRRNRVPVLSFQPSENAPVFVYMGATQDAKTAVFMVADETQPTDGQQFCSPAPEQCELLALKQGDAATIFSELDGKSYRIKVLDIRLVVSKKPPKR
jgi:hypothetical protein